MAKKFKNKYRIDSTRLKNYDYSQNGVYFVTIVTKDHDNFFGKIVDGKMILNDIGRIVWDEWNKTPQIRSDMNLKMVEFIVMPNHVHGVIFIGDNDYNTHYDCNRRDAMHRVSTPTATPTNYKNKFAPQRKNLSSIIRGFKSVVTKKSREINQNFAWQSRFHDRVIRDKNELNRIRNYIIKNPEIWERDRNNPRL